MGVVYVMTRQEELLDGQRKIIESLRDELVNKDLIISSLNDRIKILEEQD